MYLANRTAWACRTAVGAGGSGGPTSPGRRRVRRLLDVPPGPHRNRGTVTVVTENLRVGAPETGDVVTYGAHLRLGDLLSAQWLKSDPPAHDELLFITIHQVYEMWFKLVLYELTDARDRLLEGDARIARLRLNRCRVIGQVLVEQVDVIDTMSPQDFLAFRGSYASASGLQSVQFREIEFISGLKDPDYIARFHGLTSEERERLERRLAEPSLWDAFLVTLRHAGFDTGTHQERLDAFLAIARDRDKYDRLWDLTEALVDHDQTWLHWRSRHVLMAERQIGTKIGTGGSSGGEYLRSRLPLRFYPELWELRSHL